MLMQVYKSIQCRGIKPGTVVVSTAGHDTCRLYLVMSIDLPFVWLSDGKNRPVEKQKKKRIRHVKCIGETGQQEWDHLMKSTLDDGQKNARIRSLIDSFVNMNQTKEDRRCQKKT